MLVLKHWLLADGKTILIPELFETPGEWIAYVATKWPKATPVAEYISTRNQSGSQAKYAVDKLTVLLNRQAKRILEPVHTMGFELVGGKYVPVAQEGNSL